ncbi:MAG: helix-turn-helix transcriptional regulator [Veillonellales bacterium]
MHLNDETQEIVNRLKELRARTGLSQAKFAQLIGVSSGNVSNWENGSLPGALALKNIAQKLMCSVDWILTGVESSQQIQKVEAIFDPDLKEMFDVLTELMQSGDADLRGWAKIQFQNAFKEHCATLTEKKLHA